MEKSQQNKFILFLLISLVILAIGMMGFLYHMFSNEGGQCLSNPIVYAEAKMEEAYNGSVNIACGCREVFSLGDDDWWKEDWDVGDKE